MKILSAILMITILFYSCKKDQKEYGNSVYMEAENANGLYICNLKNYAVSNINYKNDVTGHLFINGSDFYYPSVTGYFKNGIKIDLPDAAVIKSVFVKDNDVYAAGSITPYGACYWKKNQIIRLTNDAVDTAYSTSEILVYENDVYVGGQMYVKGKANTVVYWKNGVLHILGVGNFTCMATDGTNIYITATILENNIYHGFYWKNGEKHNLYTNDNSLPQALNSILLDKKDVYITGSGSNAPRYWKNEQPIGNTTSGSTGLTIQNKEIWVLTNEVYPQSSGVVSNIILWKNNDSINLGTGFGLRIAREN